MFLMKSLDRPKTIAAEIRKHLGLRKKDAELLTAEIFGYPSWRAMAQHTTQVVVPDPWDETAGAAEVEARRRHGTQVLMDRLDMSEFVADRTMALLRPTSTLPPKLAELEDAVENAMFPIGESEMREAMRDFLKRALGREADDIDPDTLMDSLRLIHPINPEIWLPILADTFGWRFEDENEDASENGAQVAVSLGSNGARYPVFMSSVMYVPGDHGDIQVEELCRSIQKTHEHAVFDCTLSFAFCIN